MKPTVGITMGDAAGIGPEIIMKALGHQEVYDNCNPLVIGDAKILERVLPVIGSSLNVNAIQEPSEAKYEFGTVDVIDLDLIPADLEYGKVSPIAGDAAFQFLAKSIELAKTANQLHLHCSSEQGGLAPRWSPVSGTYRNSGRSNRYAGFLHDADDA